MERFVAFLRGMNVGGRRLKNPELCRCFENLGFADVAALQASGNVLFTVKDTTFDLLQKQIEAGLHEQLNDVVPTFLRTLSRVQKLAAAAPFSPDELARSTGKIQVVFLASKVSSKAKKLMAELSTDDDQFKCDKAELFWLPKAGISDSQLKWAEVERICGPTTVRTQLTLGRIAKRFG